MHHLQERRISDKRITITDLQMQISMAVFSHLIRRIAGEFLLEESHDLNDQNIRNTATPPTNKQTPEKNPGECQSLKRD